MVSLDGARCGWPNLIVVVGWGLSRQLLEAQQRKRRPCQGKLRGRAKGNVFLVGYLEPKLNIERY